ncbi:uncharacterized protein TRIADDRAFT_63801 [Trichoplax adhaerens]|uniref:Peroxisomal bifunctional enzyme n=1 Tax=Trichoplax adhaerens TaxID=10228 RepID=B3RQJ3_TRIAD|nr:hypothetical protein TRIADDRAFT_63801 [Trichoplax adhaerens]EDV26706.1 hypothetical protein TRIADDRAFT_63801 [Trichoplax adhaerens]|eukprot:XP_002110702.1 hypothetical protein TRIADDRAFT_63801 [Trichoplax adhaerens]
MTYSAFQRADSTHLAFEKAFLLNTVDTKCEQDRRIRVIILIGKGATFPAGADITEFPKLVAGLMKDKTPTGLLCNGLDKISKPIVAAMHGTALGGGLELAMGCHYRIATRSTRVGLPEVALGILPGGSGTQRLPRLVGAEMAMDLISSGRHITALEGFRIGVIDKIVDEPLLDSAIDFAKAIADKPVADRMECIKCVSYSVLPYEEGMKKEEQSMKVLMASYQARALQYSFFAQRSAPKWSLSGVNSKNVKPIPVKTVGIIGAGTMGTGIAIALMTSKYRVVLLEVKKEYLDRGMKMIQSTLERNVKRGRMTKQQAKACSALVKPTLAYKDLSDVDFVIEAVFEALEIKKEVFRKLVKHCKVDIDANKFLQSNAILCSNTSYLDIDKIASVVPSPDKVMGMHFFAPANIMKLVECIKGTKTSAETIATVMNLSLRMKKIPVLVGNCDGFVANRMLAPYAKEATFMVEEGALPHQIDDTLYDYGMPMGPLRVGDLSGLDIGYRDRVGKGLTGPNAPKFENPLLRQGQRYSLLGDILHDTGRLGQKTGKGWYKYEKGKAVVDPLVTEMIEKYCNEYGFSRRNITNAEIVERCFLSAANEGFKILEEGIALKPSDIDVIWQFGFGFPRHKGGPMFYVSNMIGLEKAYEKIQTYWEKHRDCRYWQPSNLLKQLVANKADISQFQKFLPVSSRL